MQSGTQIRFQGPAMLQLQIHCRFEEPKGPSSVRFCPVQREVCLFQQLRCGIRFVAEFRNAHSYQVAMTSRTAASSAVDLGCAQAPRLATSTPARRSREKRKARIVDFPNREQAGAGFRLFCGSRRCRVSPPGACGRACCSPRRRRQHCANGIRTGGELLKPPLARRALRFGHNGAGASFWVTSGETRENRTELSLLRWSDTRHARVSTSP